MPTPKHRPAAFTLVELLVVIAIIGLLIALLLPAVQQSRETGRRSQCSNNLKQIGMAYQCYESAYQALPPAYFSGPPPYPGQPPTDAKPAVGWGIFILPYIEQKNLYDQYNFKQTFYSSAENQRIANIAIPSFRCPSAPIRGPYECVFVYYGYSSTWQASAADYSPMARIDEELASDILGITISDADDPKLAGILQPDKITSTNVILDGASHTILVAEIAGKNDHWQYGRNTGEKLPSVIPPKTYAGQGGWADATSAGTVFAGSNEGGAGVLIAPGTCGVNTSNQYGLYSFHRTIANALFADGSVQSVVEDIDIRLLAMMITRAGGEIEDNP